MNLANTPTTWENPPPMSTLHALLFFGGTPLLVCAVISLLVLAPSLSRGPRYRPGQEWDAQPEWFGAREVGSAETSSADRQLPPGSEAADEPDSGGASARW